MSVSTEMSPGSGIEAGSLRAFFHDCRTPLAVIAEFASIVREDLDPGEGESIEFLGLINQRVGDIETLLATLQYLRTEMAEPPGEPPVAVSIAELLEDMRPELDKLASRWGQPVELAIAANLPACLCQPAPFTQAVLALANDLCRSSTEHEAIQIGSSETTEAGAIRLCVWRGDAWTPSEILAGIDMPPAELRSFRQQFAATALGRCGGEVIMVLKETSVAFVLQLPRA